MCAAKPGSVVKCPPSGSACQIQLCNPVSGACAATPTNEGGPCEDGKICTDGDACSGGQCVAGADACPCKKNSDCTDDGNLCNGTPYCDKTELPWACKTNPGTVVDCSAASDTACSANQCDAKTGTCAYGAVNAGGKCEDGQLCTVSDTCDNGVCTAGPSQCGCTADADCALFEDGNACNGLLYCDKTKLPFTCKVAPATVVVCAIGQDNACLKASCQEATGQCVLKAVANGGVCIDGNPCTSGDACSGGTCVGGLANCSDGLRGVAIVGWGKAARALAIGFRTVVKGGLDGEDQMVTVVEQNGQIAIGKDGKPLQYFFDRVTGINGANKVVDEANAIARLDNGRAVAVGRGTYSALQEATISRFDATGERTSEVLSKNGTATISYFPNGGILLGVIGLADNGFVAFGMGGYIGLPATVGPSWAQRYSAVDQLVWQQASFVGSAAVGKVRLLAGVRLAGNQLVLTGTSEAKDGARNGVILRLDAAVGQTSADLVGANHSPPCKPAMCDLWLGARPVNQTGACDDLHRCQDVDLCVDGQCRGAAVHDCSDGNPCTVESCTASAGCLVAEGKSGLACTTATLCAAGNCSPCPWTQSLWGTPKINEFTMAAAPAVQGGFGLVGYHNSTSSAGNQTGCWIARTAAAAQPIAQQALNLAVSAEESLLGVAALSDGGAWAAGWINTKGTAAADRNMLLVRVDPSGVPVKVVAPDLPAEQAWLSAAAGKSGQWVVVGFTSGAGGHIAAAQAMDATGTVQWTYASPAANTELVDVSATSDGGWVLAGHDGIKNLAQAVRVDGSGKVQWTATAAGVGPLYTVRIVALANGGFLAAAHDLSGGAQLDTRIVVWSATGALTANALTQFDANQWVRDLKVVGNQVVAVGTVLNTSGVSAELAAGFSLQGQLLWSSALMGPDWLSFGALLTTAQGLPMAIGDQSATLTAQVVVRTFSPQGQFFCGP